MPQGYIKGKPDTAFWLAELKHGLEFRKEFANESRWRQWRQFYRGNWQPGILPSNMFFMMVRTVVPRVYFRNPSVSISPTTPGLENVIFAKLLERTDNKLITAMKVKKHMKRMVQDAWMFGTGIGKKGFGSQYQASPETFGETSQPNAANPGAKMTNFIEYDYDILANMPWFRSAGTGTFIVPAGTKYIEDARWTAFKFVRSIEDVKADPRLKNTKDLGPSFLEDTGSREHKMFLKSQIQNLELYEVHDKKTGMVFIITPGGGKKALLFEHDEFANLRIRSESTLVFNDDDETFWGIPDSKILEPLQMELNEIRTYTMYHRRLAIARILAKRGVLNEEEALKMLSPNVAPVVYVDGNPNTDIRVTEGIGIPQGLHESDQLIRQDIRETQGFSRNSMGEFEQGSRKPSATEVNAVSEAMGIRIDERRDMIADVLVDIVNDYHPIIFNHWQGEQVEEIVGPAGIPFWVSFRPKMLTKTNFNVKVDPDSALPMTKGLREAKALKMYETLKTNPMINPMQLTSYLLHEMHGVQFDDLLQGIPTGAGLTPDKPLNVGEFSGLLNNVAQKSPQLLTGGSIPK